MMPIMRSRQDVGRKSTRRSRGSDTDDPGEAQACQPVQGTEPPGHQMYIDMIMPPGLTSERELACQAPQLLARHQHVRHLPARRERISTCVLLRRAREGAHLMY